jgi:hypothetical protein
MRLGSGPGGQRANPATPVATLAVVVTAVAATPAVVVMAVPATVTGLQADSPASRTSSAAPLIFGMPPDIRLPTGPITKERDLRGKLQVL